MKKTIVFIVFCAVLAGALSAFETTRNLNLAAQGVMRLDIRAAAGSLTVAGREGLAAIEVKAEVVAPNVRDKDMEKYLRDHVELVLEKRGDVAVLVGRIRDDGRLFHFGENARIDLTVTVPKTMALDIDDGSGGMVVEDLAAALRIEDGSGGVEVSDVTGDVSVDDGSGEITIRQVGGTVTVDDGSGGIDIKDVGRDVRLINTGSGGVDVSGVKGRVIRSK